MKKYIAFIVSDVVLLLYTCYIRGSLTTQENEVTPEERERSTDILVDAIRISNKFGPLILDDSDNIGGVAATSVAIMFSQYCAAMGMSMHDAVGLFMAVHKQTMVLERDYEADQ